MFSINISPSVLDDIQSGVDYYNSRSLNLGFRFADEVDSSLQSIAQMPEAYSCRYKNVRAKLLYKFPYLIFFTINNNNNIVEVLRIFNTNQHPFWTKQE